MLKVSRNKRNISGLRGASLLMVICAIPSIYLWAAPQDSAHSGADSDIPRAFKAPTADQDYVKREVMIPMRDGVKLYTVIVLPKGAKNVPIILTRTPYNASARAAANRTPTPQGAVAPMMRPPAEGPRNPDAPKPPDQPKMINLLGLPDEPFVHAGWIRVYQDVRGKYGSEGVYLMTPPPVGPYNPTGADDTTDAYDTIEWLTKNLPESNGRVGMIGSSYEGYTVVMA